MKNQKLEGKKMENNQYTSPKDEMPDRVDIQGFIAKIGKSGDRNDDWVLTEEISPTRIIGVIGDFTSDSKRGINTDCHKTVKQFIEESKHVWDWELTPGGTIVEDTANHVNNWMKRLKVKANTTLIVIVLDLGINKLYYTNQGDSGLAVFKQGKLDYIAKGDTSGSRMGAGFLPIDTQFKVDEYPVSAKDIIFAYTDGLWENTNLANNENALKQIFAEKTLDQIKLAIKQEIFDKSSKKDDLSILILKDEAEQQQSTAKSSQTPSLEGLQRQVQFIQREIEQLNQISPVEDAILAKYDGLKGSFDGLEANLDMLQKNYGGVQTGLNRLQGDTGALVAMQNRLSSIQEGLDTKLENVSNAQEKLKIDIVQQITDSITEESKVIEHKFTGIQQQINTLEQPITEQSIETIILRILRQESIGKIDAQQIAKISSSVNVQIDELRKQILFRNKTNKSEIPENFEKIDSQEPDKISKPESIEKVLTQIQPGHEEFDAEFEECINSENIINELKNFNKDQFKEDISKIYEIIAKNYEEIIGEQPFEIVFKEFDVQLDVGTIRNCINPYISERKIIPIKAITKLYIEIQNRAEQEEKEVKTFFRKVVDSILKPFPKSEDMPPPPFGKSIIYVASITVFLFLLGGVYTSLTGNLPFGIHNPFSQASTTELSDTPSSGGNLSSNDKAITIPISSDNTNKAKNSGRTLLPIKITLNAKEQFIMNFQYSDQGTHEQIQLAEIFQDIGFDLPDPPEYNSIAEMNNNLENAIKAVDNNSIKTWKIDVNNMKNIKFDGNQVYSTELINILEKLKKPADPIKSFIDNEERFPNLSEDVIERELNQLDELFNNSSGDLLTILNIMRVEKIDFWKGYYCLLLNLEVKRNELSSQIAYGEAFTLSWNDFSINNKQAEQIKKSKLTGRQSGWMSEDLFSAKAIKGLWLQIMIDTDTKDGYVGPGTTQSFKAKYGNDKSIPDEFKLQQ